MKRVLLLAVLFGALAAPGVEAHRAMRAKAGFSSCRPNGTVKLTEVQRANELYERTWAVVDRRWDVDGSLPPLVRYIRQRTVAGAAARMLWSNRDRGPLFEVGGQLTEQAACSDPIAVGSFLHEFAHAYHQTNYAFDPPLYEFAADQFARLVLRADFQAFSVRGSANLQRLNPEPGLRGERWYLIDQFPWGYRGIPPRDLRLWG